MATLEHRGERWRVKVRIGGQSRSATFPTKARAAAWALQQEAEVRDEAAGLAPSKTLGDALQRYREEVSPTKKGARWERVRLDLLARLLPVARPLGQVTPDDVGAWRDLRMRGTPTQRAVSAASVNRELNLLGAVFERARQEWRWIASNPVRDVRRPTNPPPRKRTLADDERDRICMALGYMPGQPVATVSQQVAVVMLLALATGMRSSEITGLAWEDVHAAERFCRLPATKNGDVRDVPLSRDALALLASLQGLDPVRVVTVDPGTRDTLFRKARDRCGIHHLRFHDTRATFCTRVAKGGRVDVLTLARIIGHRDINSLMTYYREAAASIADRLD